MAREEMHWGIQRYCPQAQALQDLWLRLREGGGGGGGGAASSSSSPLLLLPSDLGNNYSTPSLLSPSAFARSCTASASAARTRLLQNWLPHAAATLDAPRPPICPRNNDSAAWWRAIGAQVSVQARGLLDEELARLRTLADGNSPVLELEVVVVGGGGGEGGNDDDDNGSLGLALHPSASDAREALLGAVDAALMAVSGLPALSEEFVRVAAAAGGAARAAAAAAEAAVAAAAAEADEGEDGALPPPPNYRRSKRPVRLRGFRSPADRAGRVQVITAAAFEASLEAAKEAAVAAAAGGGASFSSSSSSLLRVDSGKDSAVASARAALERATGPDMRALEALVAPKLAPLVAELGPLLAAAGDNDEEKEAAKRHAAPLISAVVASLAVTRPVPLSETAAALERCEAELARLRKAAASAAGSACPDDVHAPGGLCVLRCAGAKRTLAAAAERGVTAALEGVRLAVRAACDGTAEEYKAAHASLLADEGEGEGGGGTCSASAAVLGLHRAIARVGVEVAAARACPRTGVLARVGLARAFLLRHRWPPVGLDNDEEESSNGDVRAWVEAASWPARLADALAKARTRAAAERLSLERALAARRAQLEAEAAAALEAASTMRTRGGASAAEEAAGAEEAEALALRLSAAAQQLRDISAEENALLLLVPAEPTADHATAATLLVERLDSASSHERLCAELWRCASEANAKVAQWTTAPLRRVGAREAAEECTRLRERLATVESAMAAAGGAALEQQALADAGARLARFVDSAEELPLLLALRPPPPAMLADAAWAALNRDAGLDLNRGEAVSLKALAAFVGGSTGAARLATLARSLTTTGATTTVAAPGGG